MVFFVILFCNTNNIVEETLLPLSSLIWLLGMKDLRGGGKQEEGEEEGVGGSGRNDNGGKIKTERFLPLNIFSWTHD